MPRPTPVRRLAALALRTSLVAVLAVGASAHGGLYRGPGATVPPAAGPGPGAAGGPNLGSPGGGSTGDLSSWTTWWSFRRDPYIDLKRAVHAAPVTSPGTGFPLGRGEEPQRTSSFRPDRAFLRDEVVPALIAALERERNKDIRTACLLALAKIGDDSYGEHDLAALFEARLDDPNQEVAETAALALGVLGDERVVPRLAHLLRDDAVGRSLVGEREVPVRTRAFAAYGLGLVAHRSRREDVRRFAVTHLAAILERERFARRDVPVACVTALGLVPLAAGGLGAGDGEPAAPSASRAGQVRFLLELFADRERGPLVRAHVPGALGGLLEAYEEEPGGRALKLAVSEALIDALDPHSREWKEVRQGCVIGLARLGDGDADEVDASIREALLRELERGELLARSLAVVALGQVAARHGHGDTPRAALEEVRATLLGRLSRGTSMSRPWAGFALALGERSLIEQGEAPSSDVARALRDALEGAGSPEESGAHCLSLGLTRDPAAIPLVTRRFEKLSETIPKGYAAIGLGMLGADDAAPALRDVVERSRFRPALLRDAATALALIGDKQAVPLLVAELERAGSLSSQAAIASALGAIGDARAVAPLLGFLTDVGKSDRARAFAAAALGIVGDRAPLPWNAALAQHANWMAAPETMTDPGTQTGILDLL